MKREKHLTATTTVDEIDNEGDSSFMLFVE